MLFQKNFEPFYNYFTCSVQLCDGRVLFSLICLIKLVMNKNMIFDADGQAAQTTLKNQRKGAIGYMIKTYVIDTNVLIQAPYAIECFEENNLVLPLVVLEELDGLKKAEGEKGANARAAVRKLESYRQKGDLLQGVKLPGGGILRIEKNFVQVELPPDIPDDKPDNRILKVCKGLAETEKEGQVILVTKDIVLRLKAQILGIRAEDFERERISEDDAQYTGRTEVYFPEEKVKEFKKKGIPLTDAYQSDEEGNRSTLTFHENEFVILKPDQSVKEDTSWQSIRR